MAEKKKLLFLHHCGTIGGAGLSALQALRAIPRELFDITVYCHTSDSREMAELFGGLGLRVLEGGSSPAIYAHYSGAEKPLLSRRSLQTLLLVLRDRPKIEALLERERPDVVVVNSMTLFWIGRLAKARGMAAVCFFRETYAREWLGVRNAIIRRQLSRYFDLVCFISNHDLMQNAALACEKAVVYDSFDDGRYAALPSRSEARRALGLPQDRALVLYVGGMSKLKGAHVALSAMARVSREDAALVFVGGEALLADPPVPAGCRARLRRLFRLPYLRRCRRRYRALAAAGRVCVLPVQQDIGLCYAAADALLAPSTRPHQLRPIYEAGACRVPVITTAFDAVREFADGENSLLIANGDVAGFAAAIEAALGGGPEIEARVRENYARVMARNSESVVRRQYRALFARLYGRVCEKNAGGDCQ